VLVVEFDGDVAHGGFEDDVGRHGYEVMCLCSAKEVRPEIRYLMRGSLLAKTFLKT